MHFELLSSANINGVIRQGEIIKRKATTVYEYNIFYTYLTQKKKHNIVMDINKDNMYKTTGFISQGCNKLLWIFISLCLVLKFVLTSRDDFKEVKHT